MPNLYPGIKPFIGSGRLCVLLFTTLFLPFLVFAQPVITSFAPQSGAVGSTVTINGSNFGATTTANIVYFGSVKATVTVASATSLSVTVPAGASYQPLTVTTGGLTAYTAQLYDITFADGGQFVPSAFQDRWDFSTGQNVQSIYTTDIDGDGKSDLIALASDDYKLQVFKNVSTSSSLAFSTGVNVSLPAGYYGTAVTAGDLDGDGRPDIVVGTFTNLLVYLNTSTPGNFSLGAPLIYSAGTQPQGLAIRDLDGDGKPEIVVGAFADNTIAIFPNTSTPGSLSFGTKRLLSFPSTTLPYNLVVADLDGDGKPDIATVDNYTNSVAVWQNTTASGTISFNYDPINNDFPVGSGPQDIKAADLDGDGKIDLAVVNTNDATVTILQNTSTPGHFSFSRGTDVPTGGQFPGSPVALLITDFDGDGSPDIAVANNMEQIISIHRNISTPGAPAIDVNVDYVTGDVPWGLASADFDGDGLPDLANIDNSTNLITLLRNKSSSASSITSFTPTAGSAGTVVTITGTNFTGATAVSFGGTDASSFTVVSPTTISATVGSGATGVVKVVAPGGSPTKGTFTYGVPTPTISNFTPASGSPGTMITINGAHFTGATTVRFGGVPAASFLVISDNQISAVVGNGNTGLVNVATAAGGATLGTFTFIPPSISISSFSPQTGTTGTPVVIRGHGFLNATDVSFGGVASQQSFTINGDTSIVAVVAGGASGDVVVSSATSSDSDPGFTFTTPPVNPPSQLVSITSFSPTSASAGDTVYIYGTNMTTATSVSFGGTQALAFRALSDGQMMAIVAAGSTGAVRVANHTNADSLLLLTFVYDTTKTAAPTFQLITFSGALAGNNNPHLQWQVRNDGSIAYYAIEHSSDSILFSVIGTVKSTRTNGTAHTYTFTDPDPNAGVNWYRLKMQDTTATYTYSTKIRLQPVSQLMPVYPNPVKYGFFYVDIPDANSASYIRLVDMAGHELRTLNLSAGTATIRVNVPELAAGTYRLTWTNGKSLRSTTILVLKQ